MSDKELEELKALEALATPGEWQADSLQEPDGEDSHGVWRNNQLLVSVESHSYDGCQARDDAKFIAAAREAIPRLIAEVERLRGDRELLVEALQECALPPYPDSNVEQLFEHMNARARQALGKLGLDDKNPEGNNESNT